jgi:hypothetical protein
MDGLRSAFLEDPLWVYVGLALTALVLIALWYERRTRRLLLLLAAPPVLAGGVWFLAWAVETDREQILRMSEEIVADISAGRSDALQVYLHQDFAGEYRGVPILNKRAALALARLEPARHSVRDIRLGPAEVEVADGRADATGTLYVDMGDRGRIPVHYHVEWIKTADGWRIRRADNIRAGLQ